MARIRTVKPEFFTDEKLAECSFQTRLLFIGLLIHADDDGRMAYSAMRIKMQVFPGDAIDVLPLVAQLAAHSLIEIYEVGGKSYLEIPNFSKHQKISHKKDSVIPPPPFRDRSVSAPEISGMERKTPDDSGLKGMEGNGMELNGTDGELKPETPPDLHPLNYASKICQEIGMPETRQNQQAVAMAIQALIHLGKSPPGAYEFLLAVSLDATEQGATIDKYFYEDRKWEVKSKQKSGSKAEARVSSTRGAIVDALRERAERRNGSDGTQCQDGTNETDERGVSGRVRKAASSGN